MLGHSETVSRLRGLVTQLEELPKDPGSEAFNQWRESAISILRNGFAPHPIDNRVNEFRAINFRPPARLGVGQPRRALADYFEGGARQARVLLRARIEELELFEATEGPKPKALAAAMETPNDVFVVHGRSYHSDFEHLLRAMGVKPLEFAQARRALGNPNPPTWEIVDYALRNARAVVALFTPDDETKLREDLLSEADGLEERSQMYQPRQNVLFEAGVAWGRNPERTVLVRLGVGQRVLSDLAGHHFVVLDGTPDSRLVLADALESAGCLIDRTTPSWLSLPLRMK